MSTTKKVKTKASDMLVLAILAYLLTLVAPVLATMINQNSLAANIVINVICAAVWLIGAWALTKTAKKECNFNVVSNEEKPTLLNWILVSAATAVFLVYCLVIDEGFNDMVAYFQALEGVMEHYQFFVSFALNAIQAIVITLIIAFAQKMGDTAFGLGKYIPYGGIFLGICWALANIFTSLSDISEGFMLFSDALYIALVMLVYGIAFGVLYVLSGRKARYALPFIAVAFLLM